MPCARTHCMRAEQSYDDPFAGAVAASSARPSESHRGSDPSPHSAGTPMPRRGGAAPARRRAAGARGVICSGQTPPRGRHAERECRAAREDQRAAALRGSRTFGSTASFERPSQELRCAGSSDRRRVGFCPARGAQAQCDSADPCCGGRLGAHWGGPTGRPAPAATVPVSGAAGGPRRPCDRRFAEPPRRRSAPPRRVSPRRSERASSPPSGRGGSLAARRSSAGCAEPSESEAFASSGRAPARGLTSAARSAPPLNGRTTAARALSITLGSVATTPPAAPPTASAAATALVPACAPSAASSPPPPAAPPPPTTGGREGALLEAQRRDDGEGHGEHRPLTAHVLGELRAAGTALEMTSQRSPPQGAGARGRELLADLRARHLARFAARDQRRAGPEDQGLHLLRLTLEDLGDLRVF